MTVETDNCEPIGLYNFGASFLDLARAASSSADKIAFGDPFEFVISHGLELIFKADLSRSRSQKFVQKNYGHQLPKLFRSLSPEFIEKFQLDDSIANMVNYLAEGHSGPSWRNRYLQTGFRPATVALSDLIEAVQRFNTNDRRWLISHFQKVSV